MDDSKLPGTATSLPSPPFVHLEGIPNFRDLGGWPIGGDSNKSVRRGFIYRCGEPTKATDADLEKIRSLNISSIYDLRSRPEIEKFQVSGPTASTKEWPGVKRVYNPVFPEESWDPVSLASRHADYQAGDVEVRL